jgi:hypothetical protein
MTLRRRVDFVPSDVFTTHDGKPASLVQEILRFISKVHNGSLCIRAASYRVFGWSEWLQSKSCS